MRRFSGLELCTCACHSNQNIKHVLACCRRPHQIPATRDAVFELLKPYALQRDSGLRVELEMTPEFIARFNRGDTPEIGDEGWYGGFLTTVWEAGYPGALLRVSVEGKHVGLSELVAE